MLWPALGHSASLYNPAHTYRTASSRHFDVHYPQGSYNLAVRTMRLAEVILQEDERLLQNIPAEHIEIVLSDNDDDANGSAQIVPRNILRLYLTAPSADSTLSNYDDWLKMLLTHELSHIVDMDHTQGITRALRHIFGKVVSWNGAASSVLTEGVAVWAESQVPPFGRANAPQVAAKVRMAALDHQFLHLDQAHTAYARYPFGSAPYYLGGRFHLFLAEQFGQSRVALFHHLNAGAPLPWIYNANSFEAFGVGLGALWRRFEADAYAQGAALLAAIEAQPRLPIALRRLTYDGGEIGGIRYAADNAGVFYARRSAVDGPTLRQLSFADKKSRRLMFDSFSERLAPSSDNRGLWYAAPALTHTFDRYSELFYLETKSRRRHKLRDRQRPKQALRAREPAVSSDGRQLVFVQNDGMQTQLTLATLEHNARGVPTGWAHLTPLLGPFGDRQFSTPTFSANGNLIAARADLGSGNHDIVLVSSHTGALVERVTCDTAQDTDPVFTPDNRFLIWASDIDGVQNLYAFELETQRRFRLTRLVGGAAEPAVSPDGTQLVFRGVVSGGFDLFTMPLDPNTFEPFVPPDASHLCGVAPPLNASQTRKDEPALVLDGQAHEREGPYRLRALVPGPDNWLLIPFVGLLNNDPGIGVTTFNHDALMRHQWSINLSATLHGRRPNIALMYTYDRFWPALNLAVARQYTPYRLKTGWAIEVDTQGQAGVLWSFKRRHTLGLSYSFALREGGLQLQDTIALGRFASVRLGYSYRFARRYPLSISAEDGRALSLSSTYFSRALGGMFEELLFGADLRGYVDNPLFNNHVVALRLALNYALGPDQAQSFFLYGNQAASPLSVQTDRLFMLRGFIPGGRFGAPAPGTALVAGYAEYRLPLWHIQRGVALWPIFFEHLHAAAFVDAGNTFGHALPGTIRRQPERSLPWALRRVWGSVGAELRLDVNFGWAERFVFRAGIAQPTVAQGRGIFTQAQPTYYANVGTTL